jgi:cyclophilin family peptidyl-prolyl cis-trans isomerase
MLCLLVLLQERLVAMGGKLVTLKEQAGEAPNGTQFMITTGPTPELDATNLIVGKVCAGGLGGRGLEGGHMGLHVT